MAKSKGMMGRRTIDPGWMAKREKLGARLRTFRERAGLRTESVGHHLNMSSLRVLRIEEGVSGIPAEYLLDMARLYGVSVSELLGDRARRTTPALHSTDAT